MGEWAWRTVVIPGPGEVQGWLGWRVSWGEAGSLFLDLRPLHVLPLS